MDFPKIKVYSKIPDGWNMDGETICIHRPKRHYPYPFFAKFFIYHRICTFSKAILILTIISLNLSKT